MTELNNKLPLDTGPALKRSSAQRVRRWAVGLSIAALAGAAGLAVAAAGGERGGMHGGAEMGMGGPGMSHGAPMAGRGLDRLLDSVSATDTQRTQIKKIMEAAQKDMQTQHDAARTLHAKTLQLFAAPTVDAAAVEAARQQSVAQHDQGSKRMTQALLEASKVLTVEQRVKLVERMAQRGERMGRGDRHGEGHGRGDGAARGPAGAASRPQ